MSQRPRILVTGAGGQLGRELRDLAPHASAFEFVFKTRSELPITDAASLASAFSEYQPQYCINAAAYTAVDKAESPEEKEIVYAVNADAVKTLAELSRKHNTRLVHISTDYVFNGQSGEPYREEDPTDPVNVYGASKLKGEEWAMNITNPIILRTSWVYSAYGNNFVKKMLRLMKERKELNVVNDQVGSPTYAADIAEVILFAIQFPYWQKGIYHFTNRGVISWFEFAEQIREFSGSDCIINPIPGSQYPTPAKRPAYSVLDKTKIQQVFGIRLKFWMDSLGECMQRLL